MPRKGSVKKSARRPARNTVFEGIKAGLKESLAYVKGEIELPVRHYVVTPAVNVKGIRTKLKLSQSEFAQRYGFPIRTLQDWELGRNQPPSPVRAYLIVIDKQP